MQFHKGDGPPKKERGPTCWVSFSKESVLKQEWVGRKGELQIGRGPYVNRDSAIQNNKKEI